MTQYHLFPFQALKVVCQDMFFSRSRSTPTSRGLMGITGSQVKGRAALEAALRIGRNPEEKSNVTGELLDIRVTVPTEKEFSEQVCYKRFCSGSIILLISHLSCRDFLLLRFSTSSESFARITCFHFRPCQTVLKVTMSSVPRRK